MKIIDISIRRRVTISMFTLAIMLFGFVSFSRLKINLLPDLSYPTLTIRTEYTGAAPAEIENLITKPIEETVGIVKNVIKVSSISRTGQSDVVLEFAWGTNMDYANLDVREKLDALFLPLEVQRPVILRFDPSLDPIIRFGLIKTEPDSGEVVSESGFDEETLKFLRRYAEEEIKKEMESALGIAAVKVSGGLEDEIQVLVDERRLAQLDIPINLIVQILGAENINLSGGRLEEGTQQLLVRTLSQFKSIEEIGEVIITQRDRTPIFLKDVADVRHGHKEREAITRLNGKEAVEISIYKEGDANTVAVAREVDNRLDRINKLLPDNMELIKIYDQSTFISQSVDEVINAGMIGGLLAIIILFLFLRDFWTTVIISLSIPVSVIATFNLMYGTDLTLNIMSLGGIALGIGMLLDNAIVVLENISRHREQGKDRKIAARDGAKEVSTAVIASTLTTVAVFFPLVFVKGISGQLFRDQALTVTFALLASLVVALTLIPMLASIMGRSKIPEAYDVELSKPKTKVGGWLRNVRVFLFDKSPVFTFKVFRKIIQIIVKTSSLLVKPFVIGFNKLYDALAKRYPPMLEWSLHHKFIIILIALCFFVASLMMIPVLGVELIPQLSQGEFQIEFKLPPGTPLAKTDKVIKGVQDSAEDIDLINNTFSVAGTGNRMDANPDEGGENWGELNISLISGSKKAEEAQVMSDIRKNLEKQPGVHYKISRPTLFTFSTPVEIEIAGYDLTKLKNASQAIANRLKSSDRFADVKSSMEMGHPEIRIHFDRERAAMLGLQVYEIARRVVNKVRGDVATKYSYHDRKIDVLVRTREQDRNSVENIKRLIINPDGDQPVPLEAVADVTVVTGPGEIRRVGQERVAQITANLNYGDLGGAAEEITQILAETPIPLGLETRLAGQNEEMSVSFQSMQFALLLAIFLVYLVMASQFESLLHPFVILGSIPLALIGAVFALYITGSTISVVVFIGLIMLAGIVVNNAIVFIDRINQLREKGESKIKAIITAGNSRLRPILMTTLTTVLGLLPMALGFGEGTEVRAPMAITVIGGLLASTLLTLIVIPVIYAAVDQKE